MSLLQFSKKSWSQKVSEIFLGNFGIILMKILVETFTPFPKFLDVLMFIICSKALCFVDLLDVLQCVKNCENQSSKLSLLTEFIVDRKALTRRN